MFYNIRLVYLLLPQRQNTMFHVSIKVYPVDIVSTVIYVTGAHWRAIGSCPLLVPLRNPYTIHWLSWFQHFFKLNPWLVLSLSRTHTEQHDGLLFLVPSWWGFSSSWTTSWHSSNLHQCCTIMLWTNPRPAEYTSLHDETSAGSPTAGFLLDHIGETDIQLPHADQSNIYRAMYVIKHLAPPPSALLQI